MVVTINLNIYMNKEKFIINNNKKKYIYIYIELLGNYPSPLYYG